MDTRHDLLGSLLSGQLTVDNFSRFTFEQILAWLDHQQHQGNQPRAALEAEKPDATSQPFSVRYAEQLDILNQVVETVAKLPVRKSSVEH